MTSVAQGLNIGDIKRSAEKIQVLVKTGQKYCALSVKTSVRFVLLSATCVVQQCKELLCFHCNACSIYYIVDNDVCQQ